MTPEELKELSMFGIRKSPNGEWRPILQRVETNRCTKCNGFGTYGNPLCGAVYNCDRCQGTGHEPIKPSNWQRLMNWLKSYDAQVKDNS
jgi:hypothetical protein